MKRLILLTLTILMGIVAWAQDAKSDTEAIKKLVLTAYVDGLQNKGDLEATREGFFPGFDLLILKENMVDKLPIYNWITMVQMRKDKDPAPPPEGEITTCEFEFIDITGTAAVAKIHLSRGGKKIFTDYLSLYKFVDGWKIVGKIYYRIPE